MHPLDQCDKQPCFSYLCKNPNTFKSDDGFHCDDCLREISVVKYIVGTKETHSYIKKVTMDGKVYYYVKYDQYNDVKETFNDARSYLRNHMIMNAERVIRNL